MYNLVIIGAGYFGREVSTWAEDWQEALGELDKPVKVKVKGFLDNRPGVLDGFSNYPPILSSVELYKPEENDAFVCAIGEPKIKKQFFEIITNKGGKFINMIHPSCIIGKNVEVGIGAIICPYTVISSDAKIGSLVSLNIHCSIGHDVKIGNYSQLSPHVNLTGRVEIGEGVMINSNVCVTPGVTIGSWSTLGAGSVVLKDVEMGHTMFGNPARVIAK